MESFFDALGDLISRVSPGWLLEDPQKARSAVYLALLAFFVLACAAGIAMAVGSRRLSKGNRIHRRLWSRYGNWIGWLGGLGIIIVAMRYADVQMFSKRLWSVLDALAIVAVVGHFAVYRWRKYPHDMAVYREEERRRRFLPAPQGGRARGARRRR
ncbi:MAG TPA: hypothetical protein VFC51_14865 [Chloroflexota bacterium]|nr:hypothetical protein [Chloroflexota bacterium]